MITVREAFTVLMLAFVAVGGCGKGKEGGAVPAERTGEIVRVGTVVLTAEDIDKLIPEEESIPPTLDERREFVRRWVDTQVLCQEAVRRGLKGDSRVEARLRELEQEYLADYLVFTELRKRTRVSEEEIELYFGTHEREYLHEYRVSQILVNTSEEADQAKKLLATKSFAAVANRYSADPASKRGGDLGYLTKGNMIPELEAVVFAMAPGEVSGVIKSDFGYHIFRLDDVREALVGVGLDDVREQIMNTLMLEKRKAAYRELIDSLKAHANVAYKDESYLRPPAAEPQADTLTLPEEYDRTGTP